MCFYLKKVQQEVAQKYEIISIKGCNELSHWQAGGEMLAGQDMARHQLEEEWRLFAIVSEPDVTVCLCVCVCGTYSLGGLRSSGLVSKNTLTSSHCEM